jgi:hypothetical protein
MKGLVDTATRANRWMLMLLATAGVLRPMVALAQGCAMCGTALNDPNDPTVKAFNWSIIFLASTPYALLGTIGGWLAYKYWRAQTPRSGGRLVPLALAGKEGVQ